MDVRTFLLISKRFIEEGKTVEAIQKTKDFIKGKDRDLSNKTLTISGIYNDIIDRESRGMKVESDEKSQVRNSIFQVILSIEEQFEDEYWNSVTEVNQIPIYQQYIETYPEGRFIDEAKSRITKIEEKTSEQKAKDYERKKGILGLVEENWQYAMENNSIADYEKFVDAKLNSPEIKEKINNISDIEIKKESQSIISDFHLRAIQRIAQLKANDFIKKLVKEAGMSLSNLNNGVGVIKVNNNFGQIDIVLKPLSYNHGNKILTLQFSSPRFDAANIALDSMLKVNPHLSLSYWGLQEDGNNKFLSIHYTAIANSIHKEEFIFITTCITENFFKVVRELENQNKKTSKLN